ncbi:ThuA domain-containing protein [Streptomyces sp. NBC_01198]|uniref:ThuA domain-containing protein n=1 Tax=Streptomyces sp. NBC_01198 TaxID=2903769 RepID=UPI002E146612|nr:ThuA domain-containing protein [Streptomyces sp. NBC_01198]
MPQHVAVFSATAGHRHDSIGAGAAALAELAAPEGLPVRHTEEPGELARLLGQGCAAVVFLSPTGEVLDDDARHALRAYVTGGTMGADHPLVWCRRVGAGRSFCTALGHAASAYAGPGFRAHLRGALLWSAGRAGS